MSLKSEDGQNQFTFSYEFKFNKRNIVLKSPTFNTPKVPGINFLIKSIIKENGKSIRVQIEKDDTRLVVAIIKLTVSDVTLTDRMVSWKDCLLFKECVLSVSNDTCSTYGSNPNFCCMEGDHKYTVPITCSITWNGFVQDLYYPDVCTHMEILYKNSEFSDVVIRVGETEFKAHKSVIVSQSPVFYKMLTSELKESKENTISFDDTYVDMMEELLLFFYKGKMDNAEKDSEIALKLFKFADMYQIDKLKTTCEYILIKILTNDNAPTILIEGKLHNSVILQQHAVTFIGMNNTEMCKAAAK